MPPAATHARLGSQQGKGVPTSFEVGVLNGRVQPGDTIAVVGAGPIGLAAIMTARLLTPGRVIAIDLADARLEQAKAFGADVTISNGAVDPIETVMELTAGSEWTSPSRRSASPGRSSSAPT